MIKKLTEITNVHQSQIDIQRQQKNQKQRTACVSTCNQDQTAIQTLSQLEQNTHYSLSTSDVQMREHLLKWVVANCRLTLELKVCTIQHCIKLFDLFIRKKGRFLSNLDEAQMTLLTCLFISCKYQEIYPPSITDFEYVSKYKFLARDFLILEPEILSQINYTLNIPLTSEWIYALSGKDTPEWVLICLPHMPPGVSSRKLAQKVIWMQKQAGVQLEQMQQNQNTEGLLKKLGKLY